MTDRQDASHEAPSGTRTPEWLDASVRGMLVGLALGDSAARRTTKAGVATQIAAFTADGLVRHALANDLGRPMAIKPALWASLERWAACQGVETTEGFLIAAVDSGHPSGWLPRVTVLRERRGDAPATVAALTGHRTMSLGSHAVLRTLPLAAPFRASATLLGALANAAGSVAQQTTAHPEAVHAAVCGALLATRAGDDAYGVPGVLAGVADVLALEPFEGTETAALVRRAAALAASDPGDARIVRGLAPHRTGPRSLAAAVYAAGSLGRPEELVDALNLASHAADGPSAAAITGAFLGATHGIHRLPAGRVAEHELGWVMDALGSDLARQLAGYPGGDGTDRPALPGWLEKYPV